MNKKAVSILLAAITLSGCASQRITSEDPVNRALKICGLGIDSKSADAYKAALDFADKKGAASFGSEASEAVNTQIGILLKLADVKSDASLKTVAEELKATRECVVQQVEIVRPAKKSELLEQCRLDVQRKLSPPGAMGSGVVRNWNHASGTLSSSDIVWMAGMFDTGGSNSFPLRAQCDLQRGTFNESVIQVVQR